MNLIKLQILVYIEKFKKVTEVAHELQMKQPTVTFHMKSLEEELGVTLYQTRGGRVWLSEAGKALYPYAQKMTALLGEAERMLEQFKKPGAGLIRLGAEDAYAPLLLRGVRRLEQAYPELRIEVRFGAESELASLFSEGLLDAVLMEQSAAGRLQGRFEALFEDELVIICSRHHKWAGGGGLTADEIRQERFISYEGSACLKAAVSSWTKEHRIGLLSMTAVSSFTAAVQAVKLGMGAAFAAKRAAEGLDLDLDLNLDLNLDFDSERADKEIAVLPLGETLPVQSFTMGLLAHAGEPGAGITAELSEWIRSLA
ncbi:LysR family transcriptional regulator [Paenibacillus pinistramenti]|uniref:LysR family transcriptional regulator n=1 Tax=Paenibacillus pinistramenti TaxID=1768003 RepID=UPI0011099212|nr:LysR family transcriptional regulator [Paenibacillus pinistramenti]